MQVVEVGNRRIGVGTTDPLPKKTLDWSLLLKYSSSYLKSLLFVYVCSRTSHWRPVVRYLNPHQFHHGSVEKKELRSLLGTKGLDHRAPTSPLSLSPVLATYRHKSVWELGKKMLS